MQKENKNNSSMLGDLTIDTKTFFIILSIVVSAIWGGLRIESNHTALSTQLEGRIELDHEAIIRIESAVTTLGREMRDIGKEVVEIDKKVARLEERVENFKK